MVILDLAKDLVMNKIKVVGWELATKAQAAKLKPIVGVRAIVQLQDLPVGFLQSFKNYYFENNKFVFIKQR